MRYFHPRWIISLVLMGFSASCAVRHHTIVRRIPPTLPNDASRIPPQPGQLPPPSVVGTPTPDKTSGQIIGELAARIAKKLQPNDNSISKLKIGIVPFSDLTGRASYLGTTLTVRI